MNGGDGGGGGDGPLSGRTGNLMAYVPHIKYENNCRVSCANYLQNKNNLL